MKNFGLIGAAGYIAPRHVQAIKETGNNLVAAMDPRDSVGVLDRYFPEVKFFTEIERFDRHLSKLRREPQPGERVHFLSICSPSYLHDAHVRLALRSGAHAICEKPLVINPWNVDALRELEQESDCRVHTVLQLRCSPAVLQLKRALEAQKNRQRTQVCLSYVTRRGPWYHISWKGQEQKSGGIALNIGIHFFDLLTWLFGPAHEERVHWSGPSKMSGSLELEWASVQWFLSVDAADLPPGYLERGKSAFRSITLDGQELEFSPQFVDLHTRVYQDILEGRGLGLDAARGAIELVHRIRHCPVSWPATGRHPFLDGRPLAEGRPFNGQDGQGGARGVVSRP
jgi:UDP-N-acetyl-2-amino-2-deoxyglucuronate dehydrogenase